MLLLLIFMLNAQFGSHFPVDIHALFANKGTTRPTRVMSFHVLEKLLASMNRNTLAQRKPCLLVIFLHRILTSNLSIDKFWHYAIEFL